MVHQPTDDAALSASLNAGPSPLLSPDEVALLERYRAAQQPGTSVLYLFIVVTNELRATYRDRVIEDAAHRGAQREIAAVLAPHDYRYGWLRPEASVAHEPAYGFDGAPIRCRHCRAPIIVDRALDVRTWVDTATANPRCPALGAGRGHDPA